MSKFDPTVMNKMNGFADGLDFEYTMSKAMADELWNHCRKGDEKKMEKEQYFCHYVNTQLGLCGNCIGVKITQ